MPLSDGQREKEEPDERLQATHPRRAQPARRRGAAGARGNVAGEREHRDPDQRGHRGQRPVGQRRGDRAGRADDPDRPEHVTMTTNNTYEPLTRDELSALAGEELPERAAMSLVNANVAAPINAALALNVLSDGSVAYANAQQAADIVQSN